MINILIIVSSVSIVVGIAGLIIGCVSLSMVIGLTRSTHQVVFKEVNPTDKISDPFESESFGEDEVFENPNKRIKEKTFEKFKNDLNAETEEPLADLDDPGITSNF